MVQPTIIFLNGASSSGKSTLARALQAQLEPVWLHFSEDMFFDALPAAAFERPDFLEVGTRLYAGFARCAATMAGLGHHLVVDTSAWVPGSMATFARALEGIPVLAVGLHCQLEELERRERRRGNRSAGLARRQAEVVHAEALYDVEIDTTDGDTEAWVARVSSAWREPPTPSAFTRLQARR